MDYVVGDISVCAHIHMYYLSMTIPVSLPFPHRSGHKGGIPATLWQSHKTERREDKKEHGRDRRGIQGAGRI